MVNTRSCLIQSLAEKFNHIDSCKRLQEIAYESHSPCYVASSPTFCDIWPDNVLALTEIFRVEDFLSMEAWKQILLTVSFCATHTR